jgi:hypothetical protein
MPCKKSELITAMNSYVSARLSQDATLINMAASLLQNMVDSLTFSPEEEAAETPVEEEGDE